MIKCVFHLPKLYVGRIPRHISLVVFGYQKLAQAGLLDLSFSDDVKEQSQFPYHYLAEVNQYRVFYDVEDGIFLTPDETDCLLDNCDFIFKRSYDSHYAQKLRNRKRYLPLGLNYASFFPCGNLTGVLGRGLAAIGRAVRRHTGIERLSSYVRDIDKYWTIGSEVNPDIDILFSTRLWENPAKIPKRSFISRKLTKGAALSDAIDTDERVEERIEYVRELRRVFRGRNLVCGISDSQTAREICPEYVLPNRLTDRMNFRKLIRRSKVCVTTTGLWKSIGWKFAEYVAGGKAIVSNPLCYEVPGSFEAGKNYITFCNKDELAAGCDRLLADAKLRRAMQLRNQYYYLHYVRPDVQVLNSLMKVFENI